MAEISSGPKEEKIQRVLAQKKKKRRVILILFRRKKNISIHIYTHTRPDFLGLL